MGLEDKGSGMDQTGDPKADGGGRMAKARAKSGSEVPGSSGLDGASGVNIVNTKAKSFS